MRSDPCSVFDVYELARTVERTTGLDAFLYVSNDLRINKWFCGDGIALQFQMLGNHKYAIHMYGENHNSLKSLRNWIINCGAWMFDNTDCTALIVFCKKDDMKLRFLLEATGVDSPCILTDADGEGRDELLYVYSKSKREQYEEKLKCHKHYQQ